MTLIDLEIPSFPEAAFDTDDKVAHLGRYIVHSKREMYGISETEYRSSISPRVLNYKAGKEASIRYFVQPMASLILAVNGLDGHSFKNPLVVPVPSSTAIDDVSFSTVPRGMNRNFPQKNRDDRNSLLGQKLAETLEMEYAEAVFRSVTKQQKDHMPPEAQLETLGSRRTGKKGLDAIFLIDDVYTFGNTIESVRMNLRQRQPGVPILAFVIARV